MLLELALKWLYYGFLNGFRWFPGLPSPSRGPDDVANVRHIHGSNTGGGLRTNTMSKHVQKSYVKQMYLFYMYIILNIINNM